MKTLVLFCGTVLILFSGWTEAGSGSCGVRSQAKNIDLDIDDSECDMQPIVVKHFRRLLGTQLTVKIIRDNPTQQYGNCWEIDLASPCLCVTTSAGVVKTLPGNEVMVADYGGCILKAEATFVVEDQPGVCVQLSEIPPTAQDVSNMQRTQEALDRLIRN